MMISGISGQLYKQFALTIAASTVLSGFNSLTLTPALCALFLKKSKPSNFFIYKGFNKAYDKTQGVYDSTVKWLLQRPLISFVSFAILTVIAVILFMRWPSTFIPDEDDGYFIAVVQLPPAASWNVHKLSGIKSMLFWILIRKWRITLESLVSP